MGLLIIVNGGFMLLSSLVSFYYKDGVGSSILLAAIVTLILGAIFMFTNQKHKKDVQKRDGFIMYLQKLCGLRELRGSSVNLY